MRLLFAPDKFKGSLDGWEVARALEAGFREGFPALEASLLPIADGGEGTAAALGHALGGRLEEIAAVDALGRPCRAPVAFCPDFAVFDMASAAGLAQIAPARRDPWAASTRGVGLVLRELEARGVGRVLIGLGGSATNDAGVGMAAALGYRFLDRDGAEVEAAPRCFGRIASVAPPVRPPSLAVTGLCDVTTRLLGPEGASHVYGPQKGLKDPAELDAALARLADLLSAGLGRDSRELPRSGAAGGMGYGLAMFCGAELADGFDTVAAALRLEEAVRRSDRVVTGEGRIDRQTLLGKGLAGVARLARRHGKPVHAFCGGLEDGVETGGVFDGVHPLVDGTVTREEALARPRELLQLKAAAVAREWARQEGSA